MAIGLAASSSVIPAKSTLAELQADVLNWVSGSQDDDDLDRLARSGINQGIHRLNTRNWSKLVKSQTIPLTVDIWRYDVNDDFRAPSECIRLNPSGRDDGPIDFLERRALRAEYPVRTESGSPWAYTVDYHSRKLELCKPPDSAFIAKYPNLFVEYYFRQARLVNPSDTIVMPPEFELYLTWYGRSYVSGIEQPAKLREAQFEREQVWAMLVKDDTNDNSDWE